MLVLVAGCGRAGEACSSDNDCAIGYSCCGNECCSEDTGICCGEICCPKLPDWNCIDEKCIAPKDCEGSNCDPELYI